LLKKLINSCIKEFLAQRTISMPLNIPILLTWFRIVMIPVFFAVFYVPDSILSLHNKHLVCALVFGFAAVTDWLDGYLARSLNQTSAFGAFLDPVADKLMVAAALVLLVNLEYVDAIIAFIIIGREITISALREWMAQLGESKSTAVSMLGKIKTVFQMVAILLLLYHEPVLSFSVHAAGTLLIYIAAILTLWSMVYYLMLAMPQIRKKSRE
jgi:cardiolipin synthase (CMP-forming)